MNFADKVAVVTGGASGIGRATCEAFARYGANVVVVDCNDGEPVARAIRQGGREAVFVRADTSKPEEVQRYVDAASERFGRIDCFFNNAGIGGVISPITDYPEDDFDAVMAVNAKGVFLGLKYVLPVMIKQRSGAVVNMSSGAALIASMGMSAYIASKHAVIGLTKAASGEAGPFGVRVNAIMPTNVDTAMSQKLQSQFDDPQAAKERYRKSIPLQRFPTPSDIANGVLFLCSDLAGCISGIKLPIDGGRTATAGSFANSAEE
ncbi:MAG: hypothetical protein APF78_01195 [Sphingomonadales bacterium BRH_c3]|nr:MAG: hypothetical protein APF78_01195 [Sphingomonadales bacterium BRH_c3]